MHIVFIRNLGQACASIFPAESHFSVGGEARGWDGVGGAGCLAMETGESSDILLSFWGSQEEGQQNVREL